MILESKLLVGLFPLLLGIANHFKVFAPSPDVLAMRVKNKKLDLSERLVKCHMRLFEHFKSLIVYDEELTSFTPEKALRGDGHGEEDHFSAYTSELFRLSTVMAHLDSLQLFSSRYYSGQFYLTIFSCFVFFGVFIPRIEADILFYSFLGIFFAQCVCLIGLRACDKKILSYEETT